MRISNKVLQNNFINNLSKNTEQLYKIEKQLSSGKELEKPSDDPIGVAKIMSLTRDIDNREQYIRNMDDAMSWNEMTDTSMANIGDSLQRLRELTVQSANGSYSDNDRLQLLEEVNQLVRQIGQDGNTMFDGRYIFAGNDVHSTPFEINENTDGILELAYVGDDGDIMIEVSPSLNVKTNTTGEEFSSATNLADSLKSLQEALSNSDTDALGGEVLEKLDDSIEGILNQRAKVGARTARFQSIKEKSDAEILNMKELISKTEDIDVAEKMMEFMTMQSVYQTTLSSGAKIIQPTLLDYLR
ncbi:flagellar hook-associated protein FlgL [Clostridium sp. DL1XJH146]